MSNIKGTKQAAWGVNYGQLGDGTTLNRNIPVQVSGLNDVTAIAAESTHGLFVKSDGTAWACGDNSAGQLCQEGITSSSVPLQIDTSSTPILNQISINAVAGKQYDISIAASGITSFEGIDIIVNYDTAILQVTDLCSYTKEKELVSYAIPILGLSIAETMPGEITINVDKTIPVGTEWTGALTTLRFVALQSGTTEVSVISDPAVVGNTFTPIYTLEFYEEVWGGGGLEYEPTDAYIIDVNSTDTVYMYAFVLDDQGNFVDEQEVASIVFASDSGVQNTTGIFTLDDLEIGAWGEYPDTFTFVNVTATLSDSTVLQAQVLVEAIAIAPKKTPANNKE